jgi:signal recognition particle subunit SRP54
MRSWLPRECLLGADVATGQEAVRIADGFHQAISLTGLIMTKLDGDARGGAVLSMQAVTGMPIRWIGIGRGENLLPRAARRRGGDEAQRGDLLCSMTREERRPEILDAGRKRRIARRSGTEVREVSQLLRQFLQA